MKPQILFDLLADPTRRRLVALLATQGELCVCELMAAVEQVQPKISRHLGVMKDAGIVIPRRVGTWIHYRLESDLPEWANSILATLGDGAVPELKDDLVRLNQMQRRPERRVA